MAEKKAKATTAKKAAPKKAAAKKSAAKAAIVLDATNVGYKAGDVYQALAAAEAPQTVAEITKNAKISTEETYLGLDSLVKEGKSKDEYCKVALA